jgi:hypothetical protein
MMSVSENILLESTVFLRQNKNCPCLTQDIWTWMLKFPDLMVRAFTRQFYSCPGFHPHSGSPEIADKLLTASININKVNHKRDINT